MAKPKPAPPPFRESLRHSRQTFGLVWETNRELAFAIVALSVVSGLLPAAIAWAGRFIVDAVEVGVATAAARENVLHYVLLVLVLALHVSQRAYRTCSALLGQLVAERVNERILEKALSLDLADYENPAV